MHRGVYTSQSCVFWGRGSKSKTIRFQHQMQLSSQIKCTNETKIIMHTQKRRGKEANYVEKLNAAAVSHRKYAAFFLAEIVRNQVDQKIAERAYKASLCRKRIAMKMAKNTNMHTFFFHKRNRYLAPMKYQESI